MCVFSYFIAKCISIDIHMAFMNEDKELKLTLQQIVSYAVQRMESTGEAKNRKSIYQEYKEWLGSSIDDWVLALPSDWGKSDANFY